VKLIAGGRDSSHYGSDDTRTIMPMLGHETIPYDFMNLAILDIEAVDRVI
jgi:hypothetical protein